MIYRQSLSPSEGRERRQQAKWRRQISAGVCLDGEANLQAIAERLRFMANVEKVEVHVERSFCKSEGKEFACLVQAILSLPKISKLRLGSSSIMEGPLPKLPFSVVEALLKSGLKCLHLSHMDFGFPEPSCFILALSKRMEDNTTLKELRINFGRPCKIPRSSQKAMLEVLQHKNYSLETLEFDYCCQLASSTRKRMDFYLSLNRDGIRQSLFKAELTTLQQWKDAIISHRDQSSTVYYLLSNNPTMICV